MQWVMLIAVVWPHLQRADSAKGQRCSMSGSRRSGRRCLVRAPTLNRFVSTLICALRCVPPCPCSPGYKGALFACDIIWKRGLRNLGGGQKSGLSGSTGGGKEVDGESFVPVVSPPMLQKDMRWIGSRALVPLQGEVNGTPREAFARSSGDVSPLTACAYSRDSKRRYWMSN